MDRISFVAAVAFIAAGALGTSLGAQTLPGRSVQFGLTGGLTQPVGELSSTANHSANAGALVTIGPPNSPLRFRLDGEWHEMRGKVNSSGALGCPSCTPFTYQRNYRVLDATANAVYGRMLSSSIGLYAIAGVGVYDVRGTNIQNVSEIVTRQRSSATRFGINGGVGSNVRLGRIAMLVEARFHDLQGTHTYENDGLAGPLPGAFEFIPVSVGIIF